MSAHETFPFEMTGAKKVKSEKNINTVVSQKNKIMEAKIDCTEIAL